MRSASLTVRSESFAVPHHQLLFHGLTVADQTWDPLVQFYLHEGQPWMLGCIGGRCEKPQWGQVGGHVPLCPDSFLPSLLAEVG